MSLRRKSLLQDYSRCVPNDILTFGLRGNKRLIITDGDGAITEAGWMDGTDCPGSLPWWGNMTSSRHISLNDLPRTIGISSEERATI